jgi:hypothetical protein
LQNPARGNGDGVRTMYALYWLVIVAGLAFWIAVGVVVD